MTRDELEVQIKKRADADVQRRLKAIKVGVHEVLKDNGIQGSWGSYHGVAFNGESRVVLKVLASDNNQKGWPNEIWHRREKELFVEVLGTMDTLQQILAAGPVEEVHGEPIEDVEP